MKYQFMQAHQQEFCVMRMCHVLQVSRSGFYAWQHPTVSPRAQANQALMEWMRVCISRRGRSTGHARCGNC